MKTIWHKTSGEPRQVEDVDAREILTNSDEYSATDPSIVTTILPPPPPAPADPLDNLQADWENMHGSRLKSIAAAVGGRSVENADQARDVIRAELAKRKGL